MLDQDQERDGGGMGGWWLPKIVETSLCCQLVKRFGLKRISLVAEGTVPKL